MVRRGEERGEVVRRGGGSGEERGEVVRRGGGKW